MKRRNGQLNAACYFLSQKEEGKENEQKKKVWKKMSPTWFKSIRGRRVRKRAVRDERMRNIFDQTSQSLIKNLGGEKEKNETKKQNSIV